MDEAALQQQCQQAINAVQALNAPDTSSADRNIANKFLTDLQRDPSSWQVRLSAFQAKAS